MFRSLVVSQIYIYLVLDVVAVVFQSRSPPLYAGFRIALSLLRLNYRDLELVHLLDLIPLCSLLVLADQLRYRSQVRQTCRHHLRVAKFSVDLHVQLMHTFVPAPLVVSRLPCKCLRVTLA